MACLLYITNANIIYFELLLSHGISIPMPWKLKSECASFLSSNYLYRNSGQFLLNQLKVGLPGRHFFRALFQRAATAGELVSRKLQMNSCKLYKIHTTTWQFFFLFGFFPFKYAVVFCLLHPKGSFFSFRQNMFPIWYDNFSNFALAKRYIMEKVSSKHDKRENWAFQDFVFL